MNENDPTNKKIKTLRVGTVTNNADPRKLCRVRVRIPGEIEPESAWAFPMGGIGGGGMRRGFSSVPPVGADVAVFFKEGDPDQPYYLPANWGDTDDGLEVPGPVGGYYGDGADAAEEISPEEAPNIHALETSRYIIVIDDRPGKEKLVLRDKQNDNQVLFDGVRHAMQIYASSLLEIKADGMISIEAPHVQINDRRVVTAGRPI